MASRAIDVPRRSRVPSHGGRARAGLLIALRVLLLGGLCATLVVPGMRQFAGEAMALRVAAYALGVLVVPAGWAVACSRKRATVDYPATADLLLLIPFLFDLSGNSFHLYANVDNYDDAAHLLGVAALTACGDALLPRYLGVLVRAGWRPVPESSSAC
jgi:hypothetical protein